VGCSFNIVCIFVTSFSSLDRAVALFSPPLSDQNRNKASGAEAESPFGRRGLALRALFAVHFVSSRLVRFRALTPCSVLCFHPTSAIACSLFFSLFCRGSNYGVAFSAGLPPSLISSTLRSHSN